MNQFKKFSLLLCSMLLLTFVGCSEDDGTTTNTGETTVNTASDITFTGMSSNARSSMTGTGNEEDYEETVVSDLIASWDCDGEIVSGIVEFYYQGTLVVTIDFGNGECDGVATVTWVDENGDTHTEEIPVEDIFEDDEEDEEWEEESICFDFVYPLTVQMPDNSTITIENEEGFDQIESWYEANEETEEEPTFVYPIQVIIEGDNGEETIDIANEEDFEELLALCDEEYEGDYDEEEEECFEFVFPVSMVMPDGSTVTINSEEDFEVVEQWYEANPNVEEEPSIVYPFDVIIEDDGEEVQITVENEEAFEELLVACEGEDYEEDEDDICFDFVYPFTVNMPDSSSITLQSEDDFDIIEQWYEANDSEEEPSIVYPISIVYEEDNGGQTTVVIENETAFEEALEACEE